VSRNPRGGHHNIGFRCAREAAFIYRYRECRFII
jgi:hypothetical protein